MSSPDLAAAYAASGGDTGVFSSKVGDYVRARPAYPALFDALATRHGQSPLPDDRLDRAAPRSCWMDLVRN